MGILSKKARERRKHTRYKKNLSVHIKHRSHKVSGKLKQNDINEHAPTETNGKDISQSGLCFYSDTDYEAGMVLEMTIRIAGIKDETGRTPMYLMSSTVPVRANARVMWCKPAENNRGYEVGVAFEDINGDDQKILQKNLTD